MMCVFCYPELARIVAQNDHVYALRDGFPVTHLHTLIIPKRHCKDFLEMTNLELLNANMLIRELTQEIIAEDPTVTGFNIGMNCGEVAGQTIMHSHIHLIPRRAGDVENPRGGVRNTVPGKGDYSE